jgi:hypothetical protein
VEVRKEAMNTEDEDIKLLVTLLPPGTVSFTEYFSETQVSSMGYSTAHYSTFLNSCPRE